MNSIIPTKWIARGDVYSRWAKWEGLKDALDQLIAEGAIRASVRQHFRWSKADYQGPDMIVIKPQTFGRLIDHNEAESGPFPFSFDDFVLESDAYDPPIPSHAYPIGARHLDEWGYATQKIQFDGIYLLSADVMKMESELCQNLKKTSTQTYPETRGNAFKKHLNVTEAGLITIQDLYKRGKIQEIAKNPNDPSEGFCPTKLAKQIDDKRHKFHLLKFDEYGSEPPGSSLGTITKNLASAFQQELSKAPADRRQKVKKT